MCWARVGTWLCGMAHRNVFVGVCGGLLKLGALWTSDGRGLDGVVCREDLAYDGVYPKLHESWELCCPRPPISAHGVSRHAKRFQETA